MKAVLVCLLLAARSHGFGMYRGVYRNTPQAIMCRRTSPLSPRLRDLSLGVVKTKEGGMGECPATPHLSTLTYVGLMATASKVRIKQK